MSNAMTPYSKASLAYAIYPSDLGKTRQSSIIAEKLSPSGTVEICLGILAFGMFVAGTVMVSMPDTSDEVFFSGLGLFLGSFTTGFAVVERYDVREAEAKKRLTKQQVNECLDEAKKSFKRTCSYLKTHSNHQGYMRYGEWLTKKQWLETLPPIIADIDAWQRDVLNKEATPAAPVSAPIPKPAASGRKVPVVAKGKGLRTSAPSLVNKRSAQKGTGLTRPRVKSGR